MKSHHLLIAAVAACLFTTGCESSSSNTDVELQKMQEIDSAEGNKANAAIDSPITTQLANQMKGEYAKNRILLGKFKKSAYEVGVDDLTVERNALGRIIKASVNEDRALHSWWIPKSDLDSIYKIDRLVGLRIYPGIDQDSIKIIDTNRTEFVLNYSYHTLVFTGTQASGQDTINNPQSYQYVTVCPDRCFKNNSGRYP